VPGVGSPLTRMNDSAVQLEVRPFALCSLELFRGPGSIIRMNAFKTEHTVSDLFSEEIHRGGSKR
jgi:hypothetical protein